MVLKCQPDEIDDRLFGTFGDVLLEGWEVSESTQFIVVAQAHL